MGKILLLTVISQLTKRQEKVKLKLWKGFPQRSNQAQSFIETPYRNNKMLEDLIQILHPATRICIACDITLSYRVYCLPRPASEWAKTKVDLHKRPTIFILQKEYLAFAVLSGSTRGSIVSAEFFKIVFYRSSKAIIKTVGPATSKYFLTFPAPARCAAARIPDSVIVIPLITLSWKLGNIFSKYPFIPGSICIKSSFLKIG